MFRSKSSIKNSSKKAQGLPLNIIVLTVILLVVAVLLIVIFRDKLFSFGEKIESCTFSGGSCKTQTECDTGNGEVLEPKCPAKADGTPQVCCLLAKKQIETK